MMMYRGRIRAQLAEKSPETETMSRVETQVLSTQVCTVLPESKGTETHVFKFSSTEVDH